MNAPNSPFLYQQCRGFAEPPDAHRPKGRTALLDAIYLGLSQMRGAHNAKRALLILSDGGDNHSRYNESDIKRLVKEADTQLYAIGIFDPLGYRNRTPEELTVRRSSAKLPK